MPHKDVTDKVKRLHVHPDGIGIRHMNMGDKEYFKLKKEHPNYEALAALAMIAASNRYRLRIRTYDDTNDIQYLVIDWEA